MLGRNDELLTRAPARVGTVLASYRTHRVTHRAPLHRIRAIRWRLPIGPRGLLVAVASLIVSASAVGCGSSCPDGRVKFENDVCVRADVVDFVTCVRSAGSAQVDRESAMNISLAAVNASGSAGWKDTLRAQYGGPSSENQRRLVDYCIAQATPAPPAYEFSALVGHWVSLQQDQLRKDLWINADGTFVGREWSPGGYTCPRYAGSIRLDRNALRRTIVDADPVCGAPIGSTDSFDVSDVRANQFSLRDGDHEIVYLRAP